MANVTTINVPQADFVTSTLIGSITSASTSFTTGSGLILDANGGFLELDYDSLIAVGTDSGPETVAYTSYNAGTGAVTGVTRAQAGTTAVAHVTGATVQSGMSSMYLLNGSVLGYAQVTANQGSITATVDLTSLTVTVTVPAGGRRVKITALAAFANTSTGQYTQFDIKEGATVLTSLFCGNPVIGVSTTVSGSAIITPTAASHTYKLAATSSGGTSTLGASATSPAYILVELI